VQLVAIFDVIQILLNVVWWILIIQMVLSILISFNVINTYNPFVASLWDWLERLTEPVYRPLRRVLPDARPLDLAPLAVLIVLILLQRVLIPNLRDYLVYGVF
jgi:YggT family protein